MGRTPQSSSSYVLKREFEKQAKQDPEAISLITSLGVRLPNGQAILQPPCLAPTQAPQVCRAPALNEVQVLCSPTRCHSEQRQEYSALTPGVSYKVGLKGPKGEKETCMWFYVYGQRRMRSACLVLVVQSARFMSPGLCQVSTRELCPTRQIPCHMSVSQSQTIMNTTDWSFLQHYKENRRKYVCRQRSCFNGRATKRHSRIHRQHCSVLCLEKKKLTPLHMSHRHLCSLSL